MDLPEPASCARRKFEGETRSYRFLTYVFGGGVRFQAHKKYRDEVTPIRGASIRGQLRFWWRASNPRRCATLEDLRRLEGEVWGTTDLASPVGIQVLQQPVAPIEVPVFLYNENQRLATASGMRKIAYGAFPLQPKKELQREHEPAGVLFNYREAEFRVRFEFPPSHREDVEAALWAWESFGGLGARTRRGFGAIARSDVPPTEISFLSEALRDLSDRPRLAGVPTLSGARFAVARYPSATALKAWEEVLGILQRLRQGEGTGRNRSLRFANRPGRSRWPEADEIRKLTGKSAPAHSTPTVSVARFPRAAFGMPIVFHFQNDPQVPQGQGDPDLNPLELRPVDFERFASPLILRPVPDAKGFWPGALVLSSQTPAAVLKAGDLPASPFSAQHRLTPAEAAGIPAMSSNGKVFTDPLARFLEELAQ
jgi:CRISPR-associated protein Cmr1